MAEASAPLLAGRDRPVAVEGPRTLREAAKAMTGIATFVRQYCRSFSILTSCSAPPRWPRRGAGARVSRGLFEGKWQKVSTSECGNLYPDEIEFFGARYLGRKGRSGGLTIVWDAGTYAVDGPGRVKITTSTDEQVIYRYTLEGDTLTFTDPHGCELRYSRGR